MDQRPGRRHGRRVDGELSGGEALPAEAIRRVAQCALQVPARALWGAPYRDIGHYRQLLRRERNAP